MKLHVFIATILLSVLVLAVTYSSYASKPMIEGSASLQSVGGDVETRGIPAGNHVALAKFYADEANASKRKAEHYRRLASIYGEIHGRGSELAIEYQKLADLMGKEAEEDAVLSRLHRLQALKNEIQMLENEIQRDRLTLSTGGIGGAAKKMAASNLRAAAELRKRIPVMEARLSDLKGELEMLRNNVEAGS